MFVIEDNAIKTERHSKSARLTEISKVVVTKKGMCSKLTSSSNQNQNDFGPKSTLTNHTSSSYDDPLRKCRLRR